MIDFRYHLVSIASIFLALAVGIVLGAGPLKGTIGDTLTSEVTKLREDANALRTDLASAEEGLRERDEIITELRPLAVRGLLTGRSVALIALPDAPESAVETARDALTEAGASVPTTVQLTPSWVSADPPDEADRTAAAAELRSAFTNDLPVGTSSEEIIAVALSWALTAQRGTTEPLDDTEVGTQSGPEQGAESDSTTEPATDAATGSDEETSTAGTPGNETPGTGTIGTGDDDAEASTEPATDATAPETSGQGETGPAAPSADRLTETNERSREILDILASHGLLSADTGGLLGGAAAIVVLTAQTEDPVDGELTGWLELARVLDEEGALILAGTAAQDASVETDLIARLRDDGELSGSVSSLDNLSSALGAAALPFAVAEQEAGTTGHYGTLDSASRLFPVVATATR